MTWCHVPETDYLSAPEPVALIWALASQNPTSTPDAMLSGKSTPDQPSSLRSAPDTSPQHLSGMTSPPSTQSPLLERSTHLSADTHAKVKASQESASEPKMKDGSGMTSPGSSESLGPTSNGASLKTSVDMSHPAFKPCCEDFTVWASRLALAYSQRVKQARRMKGNGSSSWPTATAHSFAQTADDPTPGQTGGTTLAGAAELNWPTPQARDIRSGDQPNSPRQQRKMDQGWSQNLNDVAEGMWGTPRASDATKGSPNQAFGAGGTPLPAQAANWTTPSASDGTRGRTGVTEAMSGSSLTQKVAQWPTPAAHEARLGVQNRTPGTKGSQISLSTIADRFSHPDPATVIAGLPPSQLRPTSRRLFRLAVSNVPATTMRRWLKKGNWRKKRLNPLFVAWLQGFPTDHLFLKSWGMPSCQSKAHMHGAACHQHTDCTGSNLEMNNADQENLHTVQKDVLGSKEEEQILRESMSARGIQNRGRVRPDRSGARTQAGDGKTSEAEATSSRACSSQKRRHSGQSGSQSGSIKHSRSHETAQTQVPGSKDMPDMRKYIHGAPENARSGQNLFGSMPICSCVTNSPRKVYLDWQQDMRGALSALPTAYGPWIWEPPVEVALQPEQMDMFDV